MNTNAALASAARRLRYLRGNPVQPYGKSYSQAESLAASFAYEYALRLLIDEFGEDSNFHEYFYGNDPAYLTSSLDCVGA